MLLRNILVVDDDNITKDTINEYKEIYDEIKEMYHLNYEVHFYWKNSISEALEFLDKKECVIDVALIDYDFSNDIKGQKGIQLVSQIRETINRRCKIVFYTMHGLTSIPREDLISLINNDVFRFISKSGETLPTKFKAFGSKADQVIVEALIDALSASDPISNSLERYLYKYYDILKDANLMVEGNAVSIKDLITSIRLYEEPGNSFVNNLLEISILDYLET